MNNFIISTIYFLSFYKIYHAITIHIFRQLILNDLMFKLQTEFKIFIIYKLEVIYNYVTHTIPPIIKFILRFNIIHNKLKQF